MVTKRKVATDKVKKHIVSSSHIQKTVVRIQSHSLSQDCSSFYNLPRDVESWIEDCFKILLCHFKNQKELTTKITKNLKVLKSILIKLKKEKSSLNNHLDIDKTCYNFLEYFPEFKKTLLLDANFIFENDPAAESVQEVMICYPGFKAIAFYRVAHYLHLQKVSLLPRIIGELAHNVTGIDIHPGAQIASPFFIDHGTGIVIGETCVVGQRVRLYQGVTLGSLSVKKQLQKQKRHPTIEDDCVLYANATVLGGETVIGAGSVIGGNSWITSSVSSGSRIHLESEASFR